MRTTQTFQIDSLPEFKAKLLAWAQQFQEVVWLDSNQYQTKYASCEAILAVEAFTAIKTDAQQAFYKLQEYQEQTKDWLFGYLSYDLKNDTENLTSKNKDGLVFPELYFFQPQKLFLIKDKMVSFHYLRMVDDEIESDFSTIMAINPIEKVASEKPIELQARLSKKKYLERINHVLAHIQRGDIYEANFCQEFYAENVDLKPFETYRMLNGISQPPFAVFMKLEEFYALSASPERYIKRQGDKVISQPIKGTAKRSENPELDKVLVENLKNDPKEISENVMIVDLVRNDLSKTAQKNSVEVEELCQPYSFKQVHQLISTVVSRLKPEFSSVDVLKTTFPMGSMTGAPKISAMQIMEELEETKRGLYSGAIGYFTPEGDFDFNVVIRSILYNAKRKYVSCSVGGAITAKSVPEKEYEECLVKVDALRHVLEKSKIGL